MGKNCLNTGAIQSKAIISSAQFLYEAKNYKELGTTKTLVDFEFSDIMTRVQKVIKPLW